MQGLSLEREAPQGGAGHVSNNNTTYHSTVIFMDGWRVRLLELRPKGSHGAVQPSNGGASVGFSAPNPRLVLTHPKGL